jgi:hypothetical protein
MKRATTLSLAFLLCGTILTAQNPGQQSATTFVVDLPASTCPVAMHASQSIGKNLLAVRGNQQHVDVMAQRIHLILSNFKSPNPKPTIASAKVTVRGLSSKGRTIQTLSIQPGSTQPGTSDLTRALDVTFSPDTENSVSADLLLPGFTSVKSIELNTVTYADGSNWKVSAQAACRVAPDPVMLISNR